MLITIIISSCNIDVSYKYRIMQSVYMEDTGMKHKRKYYNVYLCYLSTYGYSINSALILHAFISIWI